MDNKILIPDNGLLTNGNSINSHEVKFSLNHNESETSLGQDLDSFYDVPHNNHIENTKRETEKRYSWSWTIII